MRIIDAPSPNFEERVGGRKPDMLILHYTGMKTAQGALERLQDPVAKVSAHYLVDEDGTVYRMVDEEKRAYHAGKSYWDGDRDTNSRSIGIEIVNPGHEWGYRPFPPAQMQAVIELCKEILSRHDIPAWNVLGHSDVAPERKEDPGELFDWELLAKNGIGLWPRPGNTFVSDPLKALLETFGYENGDSEKTVTAFQRHWQQSVFKNPEKVGKADADTAKIAKALCLAKKSGA